MIRSRSYLCIAFTFGFPAIAAQPVDPGFDPSQHRYAGEAPNSVLVLGTPHLSSLPKHFEPPMLEPLLERLTRWQPTAVATEDLSGLQCDSLRRYPARYAETVKAYCPDTAAAARATGLDVPAANAEAARLLAAWPAAPGAAQRRNLATVFLAAGERGSALVQWLRLAPRERRAEASLTPELVALLDRLKGQRNETTLLAAVLAARLGHERLWAVDDHTADTPPSPDPAVNDAYAKAITAAWNNPAATTRRAREDQLNAGLAKPGGLLAMYRAYNAPD